MAARKKREVQGYNPCCQLTLKKVSFPLFSDEYLFSDTPRINGYQDDLRLSSISGTKSTSSIFALVKIE